MKTTKLILGILSGVFFVVIALQSCAVTVGDALADNGGSGGFGGMMLAFCLLIGGVVGAAARNSKAGSTSRSRRSPSASEGACAATYKSG